MNRSLTKYLLVALSLLFGISPAYAQTDTPTPSAQPLMIFTENAHTANPLTFTVMDDGTVTLVLARGRKGDQQIIWQDTDSITPVQLESITALQKPLSTVINSFWKGDYSFEFTTADGQTKSVELFSGYEHVDVSKQDALQKAVQTLLDIRKPFEPLVLFGVSGGFAGRSTQLVVKADGTATYEDKFGKSSVKGQIAKSDLETLSKLLQAVSFASTPRKPSACADCFIYAISILTDKGLQTLALDESVLDSAPQNVKDLVTLLSKLSKQVASTPVTVTPSAPSTAEPTETTSCCTNTINPGDSNRYISVLGSNDVLVGAAKLLQLRPNEAPTPCVAFVFHGPLSYDVTIFDGFWLEEQSNLTPAALDVLTQSAINTVTASCGKGNVQILRIP